MYTLSHKRSPSKHTNFSKRQHAPLDLIRAEVCKTFAPEHHAWTLSLFGLGLNERIATARHKLCWAPWISNSLLLVERRLRITKSNILGQTACT